MQDGSTCDSWTCARREGRGRCCCCCSVVDATARRCSKPDCREMTSSASSIDHSDQIPTALRACGQAVLCSLCASKTRHAGPVFLVPEARDFDVTAHTRVKRKAPRSETGRQLGAPRRDAPRARDATPELRPEQLTRGVAPRRERRDGEGGQASLPRGSAHSFARSLGDQDLEQTVVVDLAIESDQRLMHHIVHLPGGLHRCGVGLLSLRCAGGWVVGRRVRSSGGGGWGWGGIGVGRVAEGRGGEWRVGRGGRNGGGGRQRAGVGLPPLLILGPAHLLLVQILA